MSSPLEGSSSGEDDCQEVPDDRVVTIGTKRLHYLEMSVRLYQATLKGDWQVAKSVAEKYADAFRLPITEGNEMPLHIAIASEHTAFVKEMVKWMTPDDIALADDKGNTALMLVAEFGIVSTAKEMVKINKNLPLIRGIGGRTPLHVAAIHERRKMVSYLYDVTTFEELKSIERIDILVATISTDMYDIALRILKKYPSLATMENSYGRIALQELAKKPFAIGSRSQLSIWERCLMSCFKGMFNKALMRTLAHQLVESLWTEILLLPQEKFNDLLDKHSSLLFKAAEFRNAEYLIILIRSYPDLIWKVDKKNRTIFHIAVKHRQGGVFNLIYELGAIKGIIAKYFDKNENNMLHLAGRLAPLDRLNIISGVTLQMQRELLWFKEIEKIVPPSYKKMKNKYLEGKLVDIRTNQTDQPKYKDQERKPRDTPWELFTKEHEKLKEQGEKWLKDTANYCMLVAALITTVVFAAAFTVPGGNNQEIGTPIFLKSTWFLVFFISDAMALLSSSTSILIFLSILTSRYAVENFLASLPARLLFGLTTLFISIVSMVVAFSATCFLVYYSEMTWLPIAIIVLASVPVTIFVRLHYQLWADIFRSTYQSRFLFQPHKRRLFLTEDFDWASDQNLKCKLNKNKEDCRKNGARL